MAHPRAVLLVAVMAAASLGGWRAGSARREPATGETRVTSVVDGDTIEVAWRGRVERVRLLGVDTPETVHPARPVECFGPEASAYTRHALLGRRVRLSFDRVRRDDYGRLLAYVEVDGRRFNDELLAGGYARLLVIPPNGAHGRVMLDRELTARTTGRGLWGACSEQAGSSGGERQPARW
jgi:micrococcal nuclease